MKNSKAILIIILSIVLFISGCSSSVSRKTENFNYGWKFYLGDIENGFEYSFDDNGWRNLSLPHDWSIEGEFSEEHPAGIGGGALPGGIGWYRKSFIIPEEDKEKLVFIEFDGIYHKSQVWINGEYLGFRPNGYISFRYEITPYLNYGEKNNIIAVKVDNSEQPNSRWYSGSGIYRNVRLVTAEKLSVDFLGTYITTPLVKEELAEVSVETKIINATEEEKTISLITCIYDESGKEITKISDNGIVISNKSIEISQSLLVENPQLWSTNNPNLYKAITIIKSEGKIYDEYETKFGIRYFDFDIEEGFSLNGEKMKILGVCNHHDLGCLGTAINRRALERQLEILKEMGCNSIRTSHNPPAPELLDLCDEMGFIVMDEIYDMWKKSKTKYDYGLYFDEWYKKDTRDFILRDRNHPSIIIWSIGNEILEQWDTSGIRIAKELASIVRALDDTRPVTSGCNDPQPYNNIIKSGVLDLIGFNYHHEQFADFLKDFPGQKFIGTETNSALATRGSYDMPSEKIRRWPERWDKPFLEGNPDNTCSSYDNCCAPWGSTHEETWKVIKEYDYLSGMYIWTGFDYLGEPTPYSWPSRSSYFGIIDLAGFPKDAYYFYQSEWTDKDVLHVFPHWNWTDGDTIDVWAYTNCLEVELLLNEKSLGTIKNTEDNYHLVWRVPFEKGTLKAIGKTKNGKELVNEIVTSDVPERIQMKADRELINADNQDLSFVTVTVLDKDGNKVPYADNFINFNLNGEGSIIGVDNGNQTSHESFKANFRKAFNGMCLVVIKSTFTGGEIELTASSEGLKSDSIIIKTK